MGESGYILSRSELIYLVALTNTQRLLGVNDDTTLLSRDEILGHWPEIKSSLKDKRYLEENSDGSVNIHKELFHCIGVCARPSIYLKCSKHSGYINCYVSKGICAKLEQNKHMTDTFVLTPVFLHRSIKNLIFDFFVPEGEYIDTNERFSFTRKEYEEIRNMGAARTMEVGRKDTVIKILREENARHSIVRFRLGNNGVNKVNVYTVYIGESIIWHLRESRSGKDTYMLKSISKDKFVTDLEEHTDSFRYLFESSVEILN